MPGQWMNRVYKATNDTIGFLVSRKRRNVSDVFDGSFTVSLCAVAGPMVMPLRSNKAIILP